MAAEDKAEAKQCEQCKKPGDNLKQCAKCKSALYCNRECQTADWKSHKKNCSRLAAEKMSPSSSANASSTTSTSGKRDPNKPFTAIYNNQFLHDRSEEETYRLLVDILRLRQEDMYSLEGDPMSGTIYNGESSSLRAFKNMIRRATKVQGLLPDWWNETKEAECVRLHTEALQCAQEKSDIQETWGDSTMPMKLRLIGERIWGSTPGQMGRKTGDGMLQMQMSMEGGNSGMVQSHLDLRSIFSGR